MTIEPGAVRRGRPRNVERRTAIASEALRLFADRGFAGTTMREIAQACGMGESLLYRYYARKSELLDAIVERVLERMRAAHEALVLIARRTHVPRQFLAGAGRVYLHYADEMDAWYAARLTALPLDPEQRARVSAAEEAPYAVVAEFLRACEPRRDATVVARAFTDALLAHVLLQNRLMRERSSAESRRIFLDELVDTVLLGAGCSAAT